MGERVNILFTSVGRRVGLVQAFRRAMEGLGVEGRLLAADRSALAPAFHLADEGFLVPRVEAPDYVDALLAICRRHRIGLVVPLIDWELQVLAEARGRFAAAGTRLLVSSPAVTRICRDKKATCEFLRARGLGAPRVLSCAEAANGPFPLIVKARYGSSARNVTRVADAEGLRWACRGGDDLIIQECLAGPEFTVDVYAGLGGGPRVAVPRRRLQVRGGEVVKALTVRSEAVIEAALRVVAALGECVGVITCQCRQAPSGEVKFFDLNPRFGGGVPLAIRAGADFPRWILEEHLGRKPDIDPAKWESGLLMLRYDAEVFCRQDALPTGKWAPGDLEDDEDPA